MKASGIYFGDSNSHERKARVICDSCLPNHLPLLSGGEFS